MYKRIAISFSIFDINNNSNQSNNIMSALKYSTVIVFGATGAVGGNAALEAAKRGAKVYLAMRNTSKKIPSISEKDEKSLAFERIQADLTDSASVTKAVQESGAKAAYVYQVFSDDHLHSALKAMKEAGIEYVVFLSSFSVEPGQDLRTIPESEVIPYEHAGVEIGLEDLKIPHTALRPAQFASNGFTMGLDTSRKPWLANMLYPDMKGDTISPIDIGRVGGAVLVNPPSGVEATGKEIIFLCGPKIRTSEEQWKVVKQVVSQEIEVKHCTEQEYAEYLKSMHIPPPLVDYIIKSFNEYRTRDIYPEPFYSDSVNNVKKYSGHEPMQFEEFVRGYDFGSGA